MLNLLEGPLRLENKRMTPKGTASCKPGRVANYITPSEAKMFYGFQNTLETKHQICIKMKTEKMVNTDPIVENNRSLVYNANDDMKQISIGKP